MDGSIAPQWSRLVHSVNKLCNNMKIQLFTVISALSLAYALDLQIKSGSCDQDLPITGTLKMRCSDGGSRCQFGDKVELYGTLHYTQVDSSGIQNNFAYASGQMAFLTTSYDLFDGMAIPLCDQTMNASQSNQYDCPGDGSYYFDVEYKLPSSGGDTTSWLTSGWYGSATITFYAQQDVQDMVIGQCQFELQTFVTQNQKQGLLQAPSAAQTAGIVLGVVAMLGLCCLYCYCCRGRHKSSKTAPNGEVNTDFKRMDEDDIPRTIASRSVKGDASIAQSTLGSKAV